MTIDEKIAVLQAAKEGKKIQSKLRGGATWSNTNVPIWDFYSMDYRVALEPPEPREIWVNEYPHGSDGLGAYAYAIQNNARDNAAPSAIGVIRFREVIE